MPILTLVQIGFIVINILVLILLGIDYFKKNYTIVDLETWNKVAHFYNENANEDGEYVEQAGGCGFFREQIEYIEDEEEDEQEE